MEKQICKASEAKPGQMLILHGGLCYEIKSIEPDSVGLVFTLDGSFSMTNHGKDFKMGIGTNNKVAVLA